MEPRGPAAYRRRRGTAMRRPGCAGAAAGGGERRAGRHEAARRRLSRRHPVDADHPGHHVRLDVAVVQPGARVVLAPAEAKVSAGPTVWVSRGVPSASRQRWPWTWKVWCSEPIAMTSHCTSWPTREAEHRRVAHERAAVDRLEVAHRREDDLELAVGRALVAAEDREHPVHPARDRLLHRRRVVVVGPDADRVAPAREPVGPGLAGLDVGVAAGEPGR